MGLSVMLFTLTSSHPGISCQAQRKYSKVPPLGNSMLRNLGLTFKKENALLLEAQQAVFCRAFV